MSSELKANAAPMRLMLLGEQLVAFRDSNGKIGVMDHKCPHRCASLFMGRNEEGGLRCIYHGWKIRHRRQLRRHAERSGGARLQASRACESLQGGRAQRARLVYMGDRKEAPPLPRIEATLLPESEVTINFVQRECNWLQALEGDIDTAFRFPPCRRHHARHGAAGQPLQIHGHRSRARLSRHRHCVARCNATYRDGRSQARPILALRQFMLPFWTQTPQGKFTEHLHNRAWVPMDDHHTMFVSLTWKQHPLSIGPDINGNMMPGFKRVFDYLPNTTDWHGRWRLKGRPCPTIG